MWQKYTFKKSASATDVAKKSASATDVAKIHF